VHQVGNQCIVNSWCTVRKNIKVSIFCLFWKSSIAFKCVRKMEWTVKTWYLGDVWHCKLLDGKRYFW